LGVRRLAAALQTSQVVKAFANQETSIDG
jgi:hypothetical protein